MRNWLAICLILGNSLCLLAQDESVMAYTLRHSPDHKTIEISIDFDTLMANDVNLIIPQSAPGTYELTSYISFVNSVKANSAKGENIKAEKGMGSHQYPTCFEVAH